MGVILRKRKHKDDGTFSYYVDIIENNQRRTKTILKVRKGDNLKNKKLEADRLLIAFLDEYESIKQGKVPAYKKDVSIIDYCDRYIENYVQTDINTVISSVKKFRLFLKEKVKQEKLTFPNLTEFIVENFATYLNYEANLNGTTPAGYFKKFKKILNCAKKENYLQASVFEDVIFKKKPEASEKVVKKQILDEDEILLLWETPCGNNEVKKAFMFGCYSGLGMAEMFDLKWCEIPDSILSTFRKKNKISIRNKISERMLFELGKAGSGDELVFNLKNKSTGKNLTLNGINGVIKRWALKAGITKHLTSYCGRHSFATRLLKNGVNLKVVADTMGHKNINTTAKYLNHVTDLRDQATAGLC
ncbi:tyrosine-type recombinase/integrase [Chryseobacterium foetidum]|uniref:tyrosine-type recombinase/integrase n=1 Tax=Chryseobacterium foetidum TaxID=2951057 RepID=UPI0021C84144|nr:site-specific integrase [Chryseobacterium foetidum]